MVMGQVGTAVLCLALLELLRMENLRLLKKLTVKIRWVIFIYRLLSLLDTIFLMNTKSWVLLLMVILQSFVTYLGRFTGWMKMVTTPFPKIMLKSFGIDFLNLSV